MVLNSIVSAPFETEFVLSLVAVAQFEIVFVINQIVSAPLTVVLAPFELRLFLCQLSLELFESVAAFGQANPGTLLITETNRFLGALRSQSAGLTVLSACFLAQSAKSPSQSASSPGSFEKNLYVDFACLCLRLVVLLARPEAEVTQFCSKVTNTLPKEVLHG